MLNAPPKKKKKKKKIQNFKFHNSFTLVKTFGLCMDLQLGCESDVYFQRCHLKLTPIWSHVNENEKTKLLKIEN